MLLAIFAFYFGYKKGRDSGRNGILWAFICGLTFIGVQLLVAFGFGLVMGLGVELWGWKESIYDDFAFVTTVVSIGASVLSLWILFKFLDRIPIEDPSIAPPPPPTFSDNE